MAKYQFDTKDDQQLSEAIQKLLFEFGLGWLHTNTDVTVNSNQWLFTENDSGRRCICQGSTPDNTYITIPTDWIKHIIDPPERTIVKDGIEYESKFVGYVVEGEKEFLKKINSWLEGLGYMLYVGYNDKLYINFSNKIVFPSTYRPDSYIPLDLSYLNTLTENPKHRNTVELPWGTFYEDELKELTMELKGIDR